MSFAFSSLPLFARAARFTFGTAALATLTVARAAAPAPGSVPADVCTPLKHIVAAPDFATLRHDPAARLPGLAATDSCRAGARSYECRWQAHWGADGVVSDPLQELGADIAACFGHAVHDVNTPFRQHFFVPAGARRVSISAEVQGTHDLRLRITR